MSDAPAPGPPAPPAPRAPATAGLGAVLLLAALGTGGLLTLMVLCNARVGAAAGPLWASLAPHATGSLAALLALLLLRPPRAGGRAPGWAYLGGLSGAATVMLTSAAANTALALSGTLALGLLGQVAFARAADRWGLLGMPRRRATARDWGALVLILAGSAVIILGARGA